MTDAALQGCPFFPALGAGIGIGIVRGEVEAWEEIGRDIQLHAFDISLVAVLIKGIAHQLRGFCIGHLRELPFQHHE